MQLHFDEYIDAFLGSVQDALLHREAENNLILGILANLRAGRSYGEEPPLFLRVTADDGALVTAALRTPPHFLIVTHSTAPEAWPLMAETLREQGITLPGVVGTAAEGLSFAEAWASASKTSHRLAVDQRIYRLTNVIAPPPPDGGGAMRQATADDEARIAQWRWAFHEESLPNEPVTREDSDEAAKYHVGRGAIFLWEQSGTPVAMAAFGGETPNGMRINYVYTPPDLRRKGLATALTAEVSGRALEAGKHFCFLHTDLANPTSNAIYQKIGYEPVCDFQNYVFDGR